MSARASRVAIARSFVRRAAKPPRRWFGAIRGSRMTTSAIGAGRAARERATLAWAARRVRSERAADWARLMQSGTELPAAGEPPRSVSVVPIEAGDAPAAARAARSAHGELICFMASTTTGLEPGWLDRLATVVDGGIVVAAAPIVVHPLRRGLQATPHDGRVRARGLTVALTGDAPVLRAQGAGAEVTLDPGLVHPEPVPVGGSTGACLLVDRLAYEAAGGMPDSDDLDITLFELSRRLRARGGHVVVAPDAVVIDERPVESMRALTMPVATGSAAWRTYVEAYGPELMREADPLAAGRLRIALTVAAPSEKVAPRWGDWHLAQALARALRRCGHIVRVQTLDHADDLAGRACDVHCVVRGLGRVRRTPGQAHVIWVISHPEAISTEECDAADLVLVASTRFAEELRSRTRTPVEVMLQATDTTRFRPVPREPAHTHDVAVVAKSRDVFRGSVAGAIAGGVRPAIYGSGWEPFVDPELVVADYVPNESLPVVYSSVGVLLNDHWQSMREWGFVSNRLFDALACETPVISDDLPEIDELFAGAVLTYRDAGELPALITSTLSDPVAARARAARGRALIAGRHTFDHRAAQFVEALERLGLAGARAT